MRRRVTAGATAAIVVVTLAAALAATLAAATAQDDGVHVVTPAGTSVKLWNGSSLPPRWHHSGILDTAVRWRSGALGVEWGEAQLRGTGEARALRLIVARLDPRQVTLALRLALDSVTTRPAWDVQDVPHDAVLAVNAGMFANRLPWGWVVAGGQELFAPGQGPLSSALVVHADGGVTWVDGDTLDRWRGRGDVAAAFQTYPTLLAGDGAVPDALLDGDAIDRFHRDARLALGIDRNGRLLIALTRLDAPVTALERIPLGLTVPEMAAVMGSLGAQRAALLDGGISAQLAVRTTPNELRRWPGMRRVPLALLAFVR